MLEISNVVKSFEEREVLRDISLKVEKGSIFGLIGPNGAGKTTLIRCITGIYDPDKGSIMVDGACVKKNVDVRERMAYVNDENSYFSKFKVKEVIKYYKLAYEKFSMERFNELNEIFQISTRQKVGNLSKGQKMRLAIMLNMSTMPEILIMDEPTAGLDPIVKKQLLNIIVDDVAARGTTVMISSHNISDLERICDGVAIIDKGTVKYADSVENMKRNFRKLQVVFKNEAPKDLNSWSEVVAVERVGKSHMIVTKEFSDDFIKKIQSYDTVLLEEIDLNMEDMFVYYMTGSAS